MVQVQEQQEVMEKQGTVWVQKQKVVQVHEMGHVQKEQGVAWVWELLQCSSSCGACPNLPNYPSGLRCTPQRLRAAIVHCRQEVWVPCGGSPAWACCAHK